MAFDAHTHLDRHPDPLRAAARARAVGVERWVIAGANPAHWADVERVAADTGGVALLGLHPWWVGPDWAEGVRALADRPALVGVGETGLDRPRAKTQADWALQVAACRAQLALARARCLPIVLHCVRAWPALRDLLRADGLPAAGGMVHAWTGSVEETREALRLGLHLSFGPDLTRAPGPRRAAALREVPRDRLLLETDCPDRPVPGAESGEPAHLLRVAAAAATIRGAEPARVLEDVALSLRAWWP